MSSVADVTRLAPCLSHQVEILASRKRARTYDQGPVCLCSISAEDGLIKLDGLPSSVLACTQLTSLRLGGCFGGCSTLPSPMARLRRLHTLHLEVRHLPGNRPDRSMDT